MKYRNIYKALHIKECCHCKTTLNLEVHHIDHNHFNNAPQNLVALCHTCHLKVHRRRRNSKPKMDIELSISQYVFDFTAYNQAAIMFYNMGILEIVKRNGEYIARPKGNVYEDHHPKNTKEYRLMLHDPRVQFAIKTKMEEHLISRNSSKF